MKQHSRTVWMCTGYGRLRSLIAVVSVALTLCVVSCSGDSAIQKGQEYRANNPPAVTGFHAYNADGSEIDAGRIEPFSVYNLYVAASDNDRDMLSYSFDSVSGSFSEVVANAAGCSAIFKTGNIAGGQDVVVELTVTDKKGGAARSKLSVGSGKLGPTIIINYDKNKIKPDGDVTLTVSANCSGLFQVKPNSDNAITPGNLSSATIDFAKDMMIYSATDNATTTVIKGPTSGAIGNILLPSKPEYKDDTVYNVVLVFLDGLNQRDAIICPIAVDGTAPSVLNHFPTDGRENISTDPDISLQFSEPVVNIDDNLLLFTGGNVGPIVRKSYNSSTNTMVYSVKLMDHGTKYTATVKGAKDALGNEMTVSKTFSFTTSPVYVLTYNGNNNNNGVVPASGQYVLDAYAVVSGNTGSLVKTGYTFAGWSKDSNAAAADYPQGHIVRMIGNLNLYAVWVPKTCTVLFDVMEGSMSPPNSMTITYGMRYAASPRWAAAIPERNDYTFSGWYFNESCTGEQILQSTCVSNERDHVVYAKWVHAPVVVTFNSQGGSDVSPISRVPGDLYGNLGESIWSGHNFSGWYTKPSGGIQIASDSIVSNTAAHSLFAHWDAAQYSVSFNLNSASSTTLSPVTVTYGGQYPSFPVPGRDKYTFAGWFTVPTGGSQIQAGNTINITGDTTLYAHWTPNLVSSITLNKTTVLTSYGLGTIEITATVNGNPLNGALTWKSLDTALATVSGTDTSCTVTIQPYNSQTTDQTVTITATAQDGSDITTACSIVIQPELPITNAAGLELVRTYLSGRFKLMNNISITSPSWTPIGPNDDAPFSGCFDGNGFSISGIKVNPTITEYCGLFGVNQGSIKKLRVISSSINGGQYCGIIAGKNKKVNGDLFGVIEKCIAGSGDQSTGGGVADPNCIVSGNKYCGGLVGYNEGKILKSQSYANVFCSSLNDVYVGGFVGYNVFLVDNCCAFGKVDAQNGNCVGGFYGYTQGTTNNCYARGEVIGNNYCSGFVGCAYMANISTCYSSGVVILTSGSAKRDNFVGDVIGQSDQTYIANCYVDGQGSTSGATPPCATPLTIDQMKIGAKYNTWNFGDSCIWKINEGSSYPYLNQAPGIW